MDISKLEQIISILKKNDVTEFELEHDGTHIKLARLGSAASKSSPVQTAEPQPAIVGTVNGQAIAPAEEAEETNDDFFSVESPIVGTYYGKPSPDADPFVQVGDTVKKGETLCIIEAMKIMNEIEAPCPGKIEKVCLRDGHVVEYGEVLFLIEPDA